MNGLKIILDEFVKDKNFFRKRKFKKIVKSNSNGNIIGNDLYRIFSFRKNKNISSKQNNELTNSNSSFMKKIKDNDTQFVKNLKIDFPISNLYTNISNDKKIRQTIDEDTKINQYRNGIEFKLPIINNNCIELVYEKNGKLNEDKQKNFENLTFERDLEKEIKNIKNEISIIKKEKEDNYKELNKIEKQIDNLNLDIMYLDNDFSKKEKRKIDSEFFVYEKKHKINENMISLKKMSEELKKKINDLENKILALRNNKNNIRNQLMEHYKELLYQGTETRQEGLSWIIRAIWNLKKDVPIEFFPNFLDLNSINYLFLVSKKLIEVNNKINDLEMYKKEFYNYIIQEDKKKVFATSISNKNSKRNNIKLKIKTNYENEHLMKKIDNLSPINKINSRLFSPKIQKLNLMKEEINNLNIEIKKLRIEEANRILKQFIENDYEKRYNVIIDVVLSALFGDINKENELNKYLRLKREFKNNLKKIRFFDIYNSFQDKNK